MKIVSISFLREDTRIRVPCVSGKFAVRHMKNSPNSTRTSYITRRYTANEVGNLSGIKEWDPGLTFEDGSKMRVYHGGSPKDLLSEAAGQMEKHDKLFCVKKAFTKKEEVTQPMKSADPEPTWEDFMGDDSW